MSPVIFYPTPQYTTYSTLYWSISTASFLGHPQLHPSSPSTHPYPWNWNPVFHPFGLSLPGTPDVPPMPWSVVGVLLGMGVIGRFDCLTQYPHSTLDWTAWHTSCCLCSLEFTPHWVSRLTVPPPPLPVYFFLPTLALLRPSVPVQKAGGEPDQVTTKLGAKLAPIWSAGFLRENWFLDLFFCFFHG